MKKFSSCMLLLTLVVGFSISASAKWPVPQAKTHQAIEKYQQLLRNVDIRNARVGASGFPDSALVFSWDNNSWSLDNSVAIRYQNGRVSRLIFYVSGLPLLQYAYTYNAAGRATLVETQLSFPGQPVQVMSRFVMNYDVNGNQTSLQVFERDSSGLNLVSGDSLQITYSGSTPTQAIAVYFDNFNSPAAWRNGTRFTGLTFGSNGHATSVIMTPWNENTNTWDTNEDLRYSEVAWRFGYAGFSTVFGGLMDISQFLFTELPIAENDFNMEPTDYVEEERVAGNFAMVNKLVSTLSGTQVSQILLQNRVNNAWVDSDRALFTYSGQRMTMALDQYFDNGNWLSDYRRIWTYDSFGNLTEEKAEWNNMGTWTVSFGTAHQLSYTNDNRVFRWVKQSWDQMTNQYTNDEKREYYFGGFPLNASEIAKRSQSMLVYPNPTNGIVKLSLKEMATASVQVVVIDMSGKQLLEQNFEPQTEGYSLDLSRLSNGVYRVVATTGGTRFEQPLVKY